MRQDTAKNRLVNQNVFYDNGAYFQELILKEGNEQFFNLACLQNLTFDKQKDKQQM